MRSLSMLLYVVKCFTVNLENLATGAVRSVQIGRIDDQIEGQRGFIAETLGKTIHQVDQVGGLYATRAEVGNEVAKLGGFVSNGLLPAPEGGFGVFRGALDQPQQHAQLNFD